MVYVSPSDLASQLPSGGRIYLFLDYDGTLAEFAPQPDIVEPDPRLIELIQEAVDQRRLRIAVLSGRSLGIIRQLLPLPGVLLAGTYGIDLLLPSGIEQQLLDFNRIRPAIDRLKPLWEKLLAGRSGFFLEDKGWSVAIHTRYAEPGEAWEVLSEARRLAAETLPSDPDYSLTGDDLFLEFGPAIANKGFAVKYLLDHFPFPGSLPVYLGDDANDELAFQAIKSRSGIAIVVASHPRPTHADYRLSSTGEVRKWLEELIIRMKEYW